MYNNIIINNTELINNVGEFSFGDFVILINVTDSLTQKSEVVERHFMMDDMSMMGDMSMKDDMSMMRSKSASSSVGD